MSDELQRLRDRVENLEIINKYSQRERDAERARADEAEKERDAMKHRATVMSGNSQTWRNRALAAEDKRAEAAARADAAEKKYRELWRLANLAAECLAGSDEREAIAALDKALAYPATPTEDAEAKDWERLSAEQFARGYADVDAIYDDPPPAPSGPYSAFQSGPEGFAMLSAPAVVEADDDDVIAYCEEMAWAERIAAALNAQAGRQESAP